MRIRTTLAIVFIASFCAGLADAQIDAVPETISYQGILLQDDGKTPVAGPAAIEVRLYAQKEAPVADAAWGELHAPVVLEAGMFSIELGAGAAISSGPPHGALSALFTEAPYWIGIAIQGQAEKGARQELVSAPYVFTANTAITAVHGVPAGTLSAWAGDDDTPPTGWLICDGTSYTRAGDKAALFAAIGTTWGPGDTPGSTFNVPNLGGRTLVGAVGAGEGQGSNSPGKTPASAALTPHALGDLIGEETHELTVAEMASHQHGYDDVYTNDYENTHGSTGHVMPDTTQEDLRTSSETGGIPVNNPSTPDEAKRHNTLQPSKVITFIIKY